MPRLELPSRRRRCLVGDDPSGVTRVSRPPGAGFLEPYELGASVVGLDVLELVPF